MIIQRTLYYLEGFHFRLVRVISCVRTKHLHENHKLIKTTTNKQTKKY